MNQFGKESLGLFPTPLYRLENISRELGTNVWIKRDDLCGVKLSEIDDPLMLELRRLDKLVDELAKGKPMDKILRK